MESIGEDNHVSVIATICEKDRFIDLIIHMDSMEISCEEDGIEIPFEEISGRSETLHKLYEHICICIKKTGHGWMC